MTFVYPQEANYYIRINNAGTVVAQKVLGLGIRTEAHSIVYFMCYIYMIFYNTINMTSKFQFFFANKWLEII
jgi:hypothetical protein